MNITKGGEILNEIYKSSPGFFRDWFDRPEKISVRNWDIKYLRMPQKKINLPTNYSVFQFQRWRRSHNIVIRKNTTKKILEKIKKKKIKKSSKLQTFVDMGYVCSRNIRRETKKAVEIKLSRWEGKDIYFWFPKSVSYISSTNHLYVQRWFCEKLDLEKFIEDDCSEFQEGRFEDDVEKYLEEHATSIKWVKRRVKVLGSVLKNICDEIGIDVGKEFREKFPKLIGKE